MGHTVCSQRHAIDLTLNELRQFSQALRKEERLLIEELLNKPLKHAGAISYASSINVWALVLLSILLEQEKRVQKLEAHYERVAHRLLPQ